MVFCAGAVVATAINAVNPAATHRIVIIELSSPTGWAMLQTGSRAIQTFVTSTHELVPTGQESSHLSMDALVAQLLDA